MILLHAIIHVRALTDLDLGPDGFLERLKGGDIGAALVDRDLVRQTVLAHCFLEEAQGGVLVAMRGEQEIEGR